MRLRAVCFDYGGTLDGAGVHWLERFAALYRAAGVDASAACMREAFGYATHCAYTEPGVSALGLEALAAFHVRRQMERLRIDDALVAASVTDAFVASSRAALAESRVVLQRLHGRVALGVISNFYGNVSRLLDEAGLLPLLAVVIDSSRVGVSKPDPAIFALALRDLGCSAAEALYVGDSLEKDVVGARAAGWRAAWLTGPAARAGTAPGLADLRLRSLAELDALLE